MASSVSAGGLVINIILFNQDEGAVYTVVQCSVLCTIWSVQFTVKGYSCHLTKIYLDFNFVTSQSKNIFGTRTYTFSVQFIFNSKDFDCKIVT